MNRTLFEKSEIENGVAKCADARAEHILKILHGEVGQILKTGEIDGLVGQGEIVAIDGPTVFVRVTHDRPGLAPWVDLILAPPRPRAMKRLLPQLAALGVGRLMLVGAKKVEKDFWGATLLEEANYRPLFIDGLMQAGTAALPVLETRRNFRKFVNEELDALFPTSRRVVAHPYGDGVAEKKRAGVPDERLLLAVGPEGGWTDDEVALLEEHGFQRYSLGKRILRTETATVALLAKLNTEDR